MDDGLQRGQAVDLWRAVAQTDELVEFFTGMFEVMGITIEETGEELTVRVSEGRVHIEPGLPERCDFLVPLKMENVTNMVSHAADGRLDAFEMWRIASVLFTPLTRETLKNPVMSKGMLRRLARVEDLIHVRLLGPEAEQVASHTLVFASGQWLVVEGSSRAGPENVQHDWGRVRHLPEAGVQGDEGQQHHGVDTLCPMVREVAVQHLRLMSSVLLEFLLPLPRRVTPQEYA